MPKLYVNQQDVAKSEDEGVAVGHALRRKLGRKVSVGFTCATVYKKNNQTPDYTLFFSERLIDEMEREEVGKTFRPGHYSYTVEK